MALTEAAKHAIIGGVYAGQTVEQISRTDDGLKRLDWMLHEDWIFEDTHRALATYLSVPAVVKRLLDLKGE